MRKVLCDRLCDCHQSVTGADDDELREGLRPTWADHPGKAGFSRIEHGSLVTVRGLQPRVRSGVRGWRGYGRGVRPEPY